MKFHHVVCGGTFDHLHKGHQKLLKACFENGKKVTIGITSGAMVRHKLYFQSIQSYTQRRQGVIDFAKEQEKEVEIIRLKDMFGTTVTKNSFEALFVTEETLFGAKKINEKRLQLGMKPLSVNIVPFVLDSAGEKISSERIRQGLIDRQGNDYYRYLTSKERFILPESFKAVLRKPLGRVIRTLTPSLWSLSPQRDPLTTSQGYFPTIAVGDIISLELKKRGITPLISVIDGINERKALNRQLLNSIKEKDCSIAPNKKGEIQKAACIELYKLFTSGHYKAIKQLYIKGEEDLLTLVAILFSPLGSHVWYGQRGEGAVDVLVTENKKQTVYNLLHKFL